ncbi:MAG TPA: cysteine peptidase family C39 domain-containing protein [Planctomycetota bacterium]|nr:cysteine peptidase family C39 domain-containing protein [Planctomycetota bacterium]
MLLSVATASCSYLGSARDFDPAEFSRDPRWLRAGDVPLVLQRSEMDCGAAAAAMVLAHWNRPDSLEDVSAALPPDRPRGYQAADLKKLFEQRKLKAYALSGATEHVIEQLSRGRPAIVGLVKPAITGPMTHYEVVVAYHPVDNRVITLDPARGWRENSLDGFLDEWDPSKRTLVVAFEKE